MVFSRLQAHRRAKQDAERAAFTQRRRVFPTPVCCRLQASACVALLEPLAALYAGTRSRAACRAHSAVQRALTVIAYRVLTMSIISLRLLESVHTFPAPGGARRRSGRHSASMQRRRAGEYWKSRRSRMRSGVLQWQRWGSGASKAVCMRA